MIYIDSELNDIVEMSNARIQIENRLNELKLERHILNKKIENIEHGLRMGF